MSDTIMVAMVTAGATLGASSGLWAYIQTKSSKQTATTQLLLGLAHDRIVSLGMLYLERGWISKDEYEDLLKYLYTPYSRFGGNGLAEKIMNEVKLLPMHGTKVNIEIVEKRSA